MRYLRFRLRTLLAVITLASLLLGIVGVPLVKARRSRLLYEKLNESAPGGTLHFEPRCLFGKKIADIPLLSQITNLLDEPFLRWRVVWLIVSEPITDEQLAQIPNALPCEHLILNDCSRLSDAGLAAICRIPSLQSLYLMNINVSGNGLSQLSGAKQVTELMLKGSGVNDSSVAAIRELSSVQKIQLVETSLSEKGLRSVAEMPNLSWLFISSSPISDKQVEVISEMSALQCLDLCGVGLQNEQLSPLTKLPLLKYLQLYNNPISDDAIEAVTNMKQLLWLDLRTTQVSDTGKDRIRQALPGIEIDDTTELRVAEPRPFWHP